jgi:hypothetical protein
MTDELLAAGPSALAARGGGEPDPVATLGVTMSALPANFTGAEPGVAIQVSGRVTGKNVDEFAVQIAADGRWFPATVSTGTRSWTGTARLYRAGSIQVSAVATAISDLDGSTLTDSDRATITVALNSATPVFTVESPLAGPVNVGEAGETLALRVRTSDQFGPRWVSWVCEANAGSATRDPVTPTLHSAAVPLANLPLGNRTLTVRLQDATGSTYATNVVVQARDMGLPHLAISAPTAGQSFVQGGAPVVLSGRAWDVQSSMTPGGRVEWSLTGGAPWTSMSLAAADGTGNTVTFSATVPIGELGAFTLVVRAVDAAGNISTPQQIPIQIVSSYRPADIAERLAPRSYLAALVGTVRDAVRTATGAPVATTDLQTLLGQPFGRLSSPASVVGDVGSVPVNELRVPVEVLRTYTLAPALLAARWTFDGSSVPSGGTTVLDVSNNGNTATLAGGAKVQAGYIGNGVSFDGSASYLEVPHAESLAVAEAGADFSVTFWMLLRTWSPGTWRVIAHKGTTAQERTFGMWIQLNDRTLHARISTTRDTNEGLDGATPLPTGRWCHVAYVKQGGELRIYLDGKLDGRTTLTGDVVSNAGPIRFGKDPFFAGFDGMLDDIRIYRLALSDESVTEVIAAAAEDPPAAQRTVALAGYRQSAYETLLLGIGTGYDELRLATTGDPATRTALADRLGITVDRLDLLRLDPAAITEPQLESLFGLTSTDPAGLTASDPASDVLRGPQPPQVLSWRLTALSLGWATADRAPEAAERSFGALIDPELVGPGDLVSPGSGSPAGNILAARVTEVAGYKNALRSARNNPALTTAAARLQAMLDYALPGVDLSALAAAKAAGTDIGPQLTAAKLTPAAFAYLLHLKALAQAGIVTESEWAETEDVLTQVKKQGRYAAWRAGESAIALSPDHFKLGGPDPAPSPWRAPARARQNWLDLLATRIEARRALLDGYGTMLADVERLVLPALRDALVTGLSGASVRSDAARWLTERFQTDFTASGGLRTTRIEQAAETVQGTVFSIRAGRLPQGHPANGWTLADEQSFDDQWRWVGTYHGWRSAMLAFFYPEELLLPTLRPNQTPAFAQLASAVASSAQLTPDGARSLAGQFLGAQLTQLYASLPAPVAVWSFDEGAGTTVEDGSSGGSSGTLTSGASWTGGAFGAGLNFDGVGGRVTVDGSPNLKNLTNSFTISCWVWPSAPHEIDAEATTGISGTSGQRYAWGPIQGAFTFGDTHAGVGVSVGTNGVSVYEHANSYMPAVLVWEGTVTGWTHVAVAYKAGTPSLYINGVLVRSRVTPSSQAHLHPMPDGIGGMAYGFFRGRMDQAAIYGEALNADQVGLLAFRLTDLRSDIDLAHVTALSQRLLSAAAGTIPDTPPYLPDSAAWLTEIFYFAPMLLALRLQAAGEYLAALDWYTNCYAYKLPPSRRKIYHGLRVEHAAAADLTQTAGWAARLNPHTVAVRRPNPYTRFTLLSLARCCAEYGDAEFTRDTGDSLARARGLYMTARDLLSSADLQPVNTPGTLEPALPDPTLAALRTRLDVQLGKLSQGRNIAGLPRVVTLPATAPPTLAVSPSGAPIAPSPAAATRPAPYHYKVLIDRTKQLVALAQQVEAAYLDAMEKFDQANYRRFQADQGLQLANATVQLQTLRVQEASQNVTLAQAQKARADYLSDRYADLINAGLNSYERNMLQSYWELKTLRDVSGGIDAAIGVAQAANQAGGFLELITTFGTKQVASTVMAAGYIAKAVVGGFINAAEAQLESDTLMASHENRVQDWRFQQGVAQQDSLIGIQQIQLANDQLATASQEAKIARLQADQAQTTVDFLDRQFTNQELYQWMGGVLAGVYRYFLQQATALAKMAQDQLAFERQEPAATFIQADYWQPPDASALADSKGSDRRGLTGSARLLQDVYQLDQYAFDTEKRKLNLSQTFSLAQLAPLEFELFRQTGVLNFATPMSWFDADFPGHYLRLIKRVRLSVTALIPPSRGIRAQLLNHGVSRVIVGGDSFTEVTIRRDPGLVALTSPVAATGVFELDAQADLLNPFEAAGVDTTWELQMPKAANPFDYGSIADVQITVDYTALHHPDYRSQVIERLNANLGRSGDRSFALRRDFPDAWYALLNPSAEATARTARFTVDPSDVPSNLNDVTVTQVALYLVPGDSASPLPAMTAVLDHLGAGGDVQLDNGLASTRRGNAPQWTTIAGKPVTGEWQLTLPKDGSFFDSGDVVDVLLIVGYRGHAPRWPS